jgi:hypothetical protein
MHDYDVQLSAAIPHGLDILNKTCSITVTPPQQPFSSRYVGVVFAWREQALVAIQSQDGAIASQWGPGAQGVLQILIAGQGHSFQIANIVQTAMARHMASPNSL